MTPFATGFFEHCRGRDRAQVREFVRTKAAAYGAEAAAELQAGLSEWEKQADWVTEMAKPAAPATPAPATPPTTAKPALSTPGSVGAQRQQIEGPELTAKLRAKLPMPADGWWSPEATAKTDQAAQQQAIERRVPASPKPQGLVGAAMNGAQGLVGSVGGALGGLASLTAAPFAWGGEKLGILPKGSNQAVSRFNDEMNNYARTGMEQLLHNTQSTAFRDYYNRANYGLRQQSPMAANVAQGLQTGSNWLTNAALYAGTKGPQLLGKAFAPGWLGRGLATGVQDAGKMLGGAYFGPAVGLTPEDGAALGLFSLPSIGRAAGGGLAKVPSLLARVSQGASKVPWLRAVSSIPARIGQAVTMGTSGALGGGMADAGMRSLSEVSQPARDFLNKVNPELAPARRDYEAAKMIVTKALTEGKPLSPEGVWTFLQSREAPAVTNMIDWRPGAPDPFQQLQALVPGLKQRYLSMQQPFYPLFARGMATLGLGLPVGGSAAAMATNPALLTAAPFAGAATAGGGIAYQKLAKPKPILNDSQGRPIDNPGYKPGPITNLAGAIVQAATHPVAALQGSPTPATPPASAVATTAPSAAAPAASPPTPIDTQPAPVAPPAVAAGPPTVPNRTQPTPMSPPTALAARATQATQATQAAQAAPAPAKLSALWNSYIPGSRAYNLLRLSQEMDAAKKSGDPERLIPVFNKMGTFLTQDPEAKGLVLKQLRESKGSDSLLPYLKLLDTERGRQSLRGIKPIIQAMAQGLEGGDRSQLLNVIKPKLSDPDVREVLYELFPEQKAGIEQYMALKSIGTPILDIAQQVGKFVDPMIDMFAKEGTAATIHPLVKLLMLVGGGTVLSSLFLNSGMLGGAGALMMLGAAFGGGTAQQFSNFIDWQPQKLQANVDPTLVPGKA